MSGVLRVGGLPDIGGVMVQDQDVAAWLAAGVITEAQAQQMLADLSVRRKDRASDKLIVTISTIGAVLLGIGAILFVAANWQGVSHLPKTFILGGSSFSVTLLGYWLTYEAKTLPKVGAALLLLGTLLLGATLFLLVQMYHVQANSHALVLMWLAGIVPLVYLLRSHIIAGLATILGFVWFGLFVFRGMMPDGRDWWAFPVLYLLSGLLVFEWGGLHDLRPAFRQVARVYRIGALKVVMFSLLMLTFRFVSGHDKYWSNDLTEPYSPQIVAGVALIGVVAVALAVANGLKNPLQSDTIRLELAVSLGVSALALVYFFFPSPHTNLYPVLFNLALAGCFFTMLFVGYQREDFWLVNTGMSGFALLVLIRYCDFFWELLPRSLFFMVGGAILVGGGVVLERKRRELRARFTNA